MRRQREIEESIEIDKIRNNIIDEAYEIYLRSIALGSAPYIMQDNEKNRYELRIIYNDNIRIIDAESEYEYTFINNTLFFLDDGYAIDFPDGKKTSSHIYVFGKIANDVIFQKICHSLNLDSLVDYTNVHSSFYGAEYFLTDYKRIENFYMHSTIFEDSVNKYLTINNLYLLDSDALCKIDLCKIKTLHFDGFKSITYDFSDLHVSNFDFSEGTEVLCLQNVSCTNISSISFPSTLKYICKNSFDGVFSLSSVDMSKMSDYVLGDKCFKDSCLKNIDLSRCKFIGNACFIGSLCLESCILNRNTKIGCEAFTDCKRLKTVDFVSVNLDNTSMINQNYVTDLELMKILRNYLNKNTLDISDSNLYSIYNELDDSYNIGVNLFYNCVSLQTIKLPVNKVVLRFKCLCNCSPQLKIVGPEIIDVYDEFFTLLSFVPVSLETEVQKYLMKLYRAYKSNNDESEFWTFIQNVYLHLYDEDMKVYYSHGNLCYTTYDDEEAIISNDNVLAMVEQYYADELEVILFNIYTDFDVVAVDGCCLPQFHGTLVGKKNEKLCSITELLEMVTESIYRGGYKKYEKIHDRITSCELHEHITYRL